MQLDSLTTGFCACVGLLLVLDSIPVEEDNLAEEHSLVAEGNLVAVDTPVDTLVVDILVAAAETLAEEHILVEEADSPAETLVEEAGILVEEADSPVDTLVEEAGILVEDTLEVAFVALHNRILAVHADQDLSHALLQVAVQVVVLLQVVRMVVPGCSYVSPP